MKNDVIDLTKQEPVRFTLRMPEQYLVGEGCFKTMVWDGCLYCGRCGCHIPAAENHQCAKPVESGEGNLPGGGSMHEPRKLRRRRAKGLPERMVKNALKKLRSKGGRA